MPLRGVVFRFLLALLLVFTQQQLLLHELHHGFDSLAQSDSHSPKKDVCATCVAFTNVHHLADASTPNLPPGPHHHARPQDVPFVSVSPVLHRAYLSRAPPLLS
jgi:hypothetical protein